MTGLTDLIHKDTGNGKHNEKVKKQSGSQDDKISIKYQKLNYLTNLQPTQKVDLKVNYMGIE